MDARLKGKEPWIGLVEVRSRDRSAVLEDTKGAFVNVLTWASDADEYRQNAELIAGTLGLFVAEIENPQPVEQRRKDNSLAFDDEIEDMISKAKSNPTAIIYGTFHRFERDDG